KRAGTQQYLKDAAALEDYLIELGAGDTPIRGQAAPLIAGTPLKQFVKKAIRLDKLLDILERKGRNRQVVTALARQAAMDVNALGDETRLREIVAAAEAYLRVAAREVVPVSFSFGADREQAWRKLVAARGAEGSGQRHD